MNEFVHRRVSRLVTRLAGVLALSRRRGAR